MASSLSNLVNNLFEGIHRIKCKFRHDDEKHYCVKSVQMQSFSGPYFPVFGLNTGKCRPENTLYLDTFHAVYET